MQLVAGKANGDALRFVELANSAKSKRLYLVVLDGTGRPRDGAEQGSPCLRLALAVGARQSITQSGIEPDLLRGEIGIGRVPEQGRLLLPACPALETIAVRGAPGK